MSYLTRQSPPTQREQARADQVQNSAGGYVFKIDPFQQLQRWLVLGSEGGTYYASERSLTLQNVQCLEHCIAADGSRVVAMAVDVSKAGRAPKNDPAIYALARAASVGSEQTRREALAALSLVCRTATHLFMFCEMVQAGRGWGRMLRRAVADWYANRSVDDVAHQMVKYRQRNGWTHRDVLRLAHPKPITPERSALYKWAVSGEGEALPEIVEGFQRAQASVSAAETAGLVARYRLPREALKPEHLTDPLVWDALLGTGMPMTAMMRNLANMTRIGLLTPSSVAAKVVVDALRNGENVRRSRLHPINILVAQRTYAAGHGLRGQNTWTPAPQIIDALEDAFEASFGNLEATGRKWLLALDVSGSMGGEVNGVPGLASRDVSAAFALVFARLGDPYQILAFTSASSGHTRILPLPITARTTIRDAMGIVMRQDWGATDCALPMLWAMNADYKPDAFMVITDNETWAGQTHPYKALAEYRRVCGVEDARLAVLATTATNFTIADPSDPRMVDLVGFDSATPTLVTDFMRGLI